MARSIWRWLSCVRPSCTLYDLAHRLGIDNIHAFLTRLGLGAPTGLGSTGEAGGLVPSPEWKRAALGEVWYPGETIIAGIGQGHMLATPLQLVAGRWRYSQCEVNGCDRACCRRCWIAKWAALNQWPANP